MRDVTKQTKHSIKYEYQHLLDVLAHETDSGTPKERTSLAIWDLVHGVPSCCGEAKSKKYGLPEPCAPRLLIVHQTIRVQWVGHSDQSWGVNKDVGPNNSWHSTIHKRLCDSLGYAMFKNSCTLWPYCLATSQNVEENLCLVVWHVAGTLFHDLLRLGKQPPQGPPGKYLGSNEAADWMKSIQVTDLIQFRNLLNLVSVLHTNMIYIWSIYIYMIKVWFLPTCAISSCVGTDLPSCTL